MGSRIGQVVMYAVALVLGFATGVIGSFLQAVSVGLGPVELPLGLIGALGLSVSVFLWAGIATGSRAGAAAAFLPWLLVVIVMSMQRSEGDLVLTARPVPLIWMFGGTALGVMCSMLPYRRPARYPVSVGPASAPWPGSRVGAEAAEPQSEGASAPPPGRR